jgi:hypothetical protein
MTACNPAWELPNVSPPIDRQESVIPKAFFARGTVIRLLLPALLQDLLSVAQPLLAVLVAFRVAEIWDHRARRYQRCINRLYNQVQRRC